MLDAPEDFCRLLLFRHPELAPDDAGRAIGAGHARLGRRGERAILRWLELVQELPIDAAFASDQPQCADAASALAIAKGIECRTDPRLRDQSLGQWEGRSWEAIAREDPDRVRDFFTDFGEVAAPDGESLGQAIERVLDWWSDHRDELIGRTVAVVASGAVVTGLVAAMLGMRLSRAVCLQLPPAGLGIVDIYANGIRITAWNPDVLRAEG
ncbi:MAG: histidine phosphatase family protein [Planctomycetes bacterium]|nr:histidine phosphatase family protein [Planctomycetota bacterium]